MSSNNPTSKLLRKAGGNRSTINTLVLNESASGVNKEELERDESGVRPSNVTSNLRSFFPSRGGSSSGTTHFNLSFNNSFNT